MDFKEYAIKSTETACNDFFRNARATPADKLDWKPGDATRSTLEICQEVAQSPTWGVGILAARGWHGGDPGQMEEMMAKAMEERKLWDTIDKCEAATRENCSKLYEAIRAFPEEELQKTFVLPFAGGIQRSMADTCLVQYWNSTYHLGQLCYVQRMLGDTEMH